MTLLFRTSRFAYMHLLLGIVLTLGLLGGSTGYAEQKVTLGPYDVHYVLVPSTFFSEQIAERYEIVRGRDRAVMNISVLNDAGAAVPVVITGSMINLLSQQFPLEFAPIEEGDAIYYLAPVRHTDRETLRFQLSITPPDGVTREFDFQQEMFWDDR